ncbi:MAG: bacteriophage holin [candidate division NC10 bacterium]
MRLAHKPGNLRKRWTMGWATRMGKIMQPLSMKGLGVALGLTWGAGVLFLGLAGAIGWGRPVVDVLGSFYLGFGPSLFGSLIGGLWGFVDGAVGGVVIAWLYNRFR